MKTASFEYKIEVPIIVLCSRDSEGRCSVDSVSTPDEDEIYKIIDQNAKGIKATAKVVV